MPEARRLRSPAGRQMGCRPPRPDDQVPWSSAPSRRRQGCRAPSIRPDAAAIRRGQALRDRRWSLLPDRLGQADQDDVCASLGKDGAQEGVPPPRRLLQGSRHNAERLAGMDINKVNYQGMVAIAQAIKYQIRTGSTWEALSSAEQESLDQIATLIARIVSSEDAHWDGIIAYAH